MSRLRVVAVLLLHLSIASVASDLKTNLDAVINPQIAAERNVGLIVGVLQNCKETKPESCEASVWSYGSHDLDVSKAIEPNDVFELASLTKTFTGIILGDLVTQGKVTLEDPISKWVPEIAGNHWIESITLLDLATHSSGLPYFPGEYNSSDPKGLSFNDPKNPYADYTLEKLEAYLLNFNPAYLPVTLTNWLKGKRPYPYHYSNTGYALLGLALGRAAGTDYATALSSLVTTPLQLKATIVSDPSSPTPTVQGYDTFLKPMSPSISGPMQGNGAILSTAEDMMKYLGANLFPESTPLAEAIQLSHLPKRDSPTGKIGLGWQIGISGNSQVVWHNGEHSGFHTHLAFDPEQRIGFFYLSNTAIEVKCVAETVFGIPGCSSDSGSPLTPEAQAKFAGKYDFGIGPTIEVKAKRSFLIVIGSQGQPARLTSYPNNLFNVESLDAFAPKDPNDKFLMDPRTTAIVFEKDATGADQLRFIQYATQGGQVVKTLEAVGKKL